MKFASKPRHEVTQPIRRARATNMVEHAAEATVYQMLVSKKNSTADVKVPAGIPMTDVVKICSSCNSQVCDTAVSLQQRKDQRGAEQVPDYRAE